MRYRVLIFDDDAANRRLLWGLFDQRGYQVFTYPDPELCPLAEAFQCPCPQGTVCADVIISDIDMLRMDGIDFLARLIHKGCKLPHFTLISGSWSPAEEQRAERLGCGLFRKPLDVFKMLDWVDSVEQRIPENRRLFNWHDRRPGDFGSG